MTGLSWRNHLNIDFVVSPVSRHFPLFNGFCCFPVSRHFLYSRDFVNEVPSKLSAAGPKRGVISLPPKGKKALVPEPIVDISIYR